MLCADSVTMTPVAESAQEGKQGSNKYLINTDVENDVNGNNNDRFQQKILIWTPHPDLGVFVVFFRSSSRQKG